MEKFPNNLPVVKERWLVEPFEEDSRFLLSPRVSGKCTGCRICEAICSFTHFGIVNPDLAAIHVIKNENDWVNGRVAKIFERFICNQCLGIPPCMAVCPMLDKGALFRHPETKAVIVNHDVCIRCQKCIKACPYNAIKYSASVDRIIKCDLCSGNPKCVEWCPPQLLRYIKK